MQRHIECRNEVTGFLKLLGITKLPQGSEDWRVIYREMGMFLVAQTLLNHTLVPVMELPVAQVHDSKERMQMRATCDERSAFQDFPQVRAKLQAQLGGKSMLDVKVNWRCNQEIWW